MMIRFEDLAAPFPPQDIDWRPGSTNKDKTKAMALAYLNARAVMDRLDEVCGPQNWKDTYVPGPQGGVVCRLSIRVDDEWVTKEDAAENSQVEAVKGGISDSLKRAAVKWGIGRYLYNLPSQWVPCEAYGNSVRLKDTPSLPNWTLPGGKPAPQQRPEPEPKVDTETG
ncbi:MAG: DNA repair protein Rad52, partial [Patescibacteria group bacterium]|nr:DNA repair protein Rad52 [Patescibacteria group bacterium]